MSTWNECKAKIMSLPADYSGVIAKAHEVGHKVARRRSGNGEEIVVTGNGILGYETELHVCYDKGGQVKAAEYIAWNGSDNTCFVRDLLAVSNLIDRQLA